MNEIKELIKKIENGEESLEPEAIRLTEELMKVTLEGLHYLTTYNWRFIRTIVTFGFLGWICYSFMIFLKLFILNNSQTTHPSILNISIFTSLGLILNYILFYQKSPLNFYLYLIFPLFFWSKIFSNTAIIRDGVNEFLKASQKLSLL